MRFCWPGPHYRIVYGDLQLSKYLYTRPFEPDLPT